MVLVGLHLHGHMYVALPSLLFILTGLERFEIVVEVQVSGSQSILAFQDVFFFVQG